MIYPVTDEETEAYKGSLCNLTKATELTTYPEACVFYNTLSSPWSRHIGNREAGEKTGPSKNDHGPLGASGRAAWPESPQRGIERAELRSIIIRTCISSVLRAGQRPPGGVASRKPPDHVHRRKTGGPGHRIDL